MTTSPSNVFANASICENDSRVSVQTAISWIVSGSPPLVSHISESHTLCQRQGLMVFIYLFICIPCPILQGLMFVHIQVENRLWCLHTWLWYYLGSQTLVVVLTDAVIMTELLGSCYVHDKSESASDPLISHQWEQHEFRGAMGGSSWACCTLLRGHCRNPAAVEKAQEWR